jgi:hypothetical protein
MPHQHGGRPGSSGRGASGGGASDRGSRNWEIAHGIDVGSNFAPGSGNQTGGGGENTEAGCSTEKFAALKIEKKPQEPSGGDTFQDLWKLFVDGNEWDLSDVINIEKPCRDWCYWILKYKDGKKTRISGNVILEEL